MDRGAWRATVHGVVRSRTRLSDSHFRAFGRQCPSLHLLSCPSLLDLHGILTKPQVPVLGFRIHHLFLRPHKESLSSPFTSSSPRAFPVPKIASDDHEAARRPSLRSLASGSPGVGVRLPEGCAVAPRGSRPLSSWGPLSGQRLCLPISPGRLWASLPLCPFPWGLASPPTSTFPKGESNPIAPALGSSPPPVTRLIAPLSIQALPLSFSLPLPFHLVSCHLFF